MKRFTRLAIALCVAALPGIAFADVAVKAPTPAERAATAVEKGRTALVSTMNTAAKVVTKAVNKHFELTPAESYTIADVVEAPASAQSMAKKAPAKKISSISDVYGTWMIASVSPYDDSVKYYTPVIFSANDTEGRVTVKFPSLSTAIQGYMSDAYALVDLDAGTISFPCYSSSTDYTMGTNGTTGYYYYVLRHTSGTNYSCLSGSSIIFQMNEDGTLSSTNLPITYNGMQYDGLGVVARNNSTGTLSGISLVTVGVSGMKPSNGTINFTRSSVEYNLPVYGEYYTEEGVDYLEVGPVIYGGQGAAVKMTLDREKKTGFFPADTYAYVNYSTTNSKRDDYLMYYSMCNAAGVADVQGTYSEDLKTVNWKGANYSSSEDWCAMDLLSTYWFGQCTPATVTFTNVVDNRLQEGEIEHLYIVGTYEMDGEQVSWDPAKVFPMTRDDQVFTATITLTGSPAYFSFCENVGSSSSDWSGIEPRYGASTNNYEITPGVAATIVKGNNDNAFCIEGGEYFVTVDMAAKTVTLQTVAPNPFDADYVAKFDTYNSSTKAYDTPTTSAGIGVTFDGVNNEVSFTGMFIPGSTFAVKGSYDAATGKIVIPGNQIAWNYGAYGNFYLRKGTPSSNSTTDDITAKLNEDGTITIDDNWIIIYTYSGTNYYYNTGANTVIVPCNAVINYDDAYYGTTDQSYPIVVEEADSSIIVYGLGESDYNPVTIYIDGTSVSMPSQYSGYTSSSYGSLYTYPFTATSSGISISKTEGATTVTGTITDEKGIKTIALGNWCYAYDTSNYLTTPCYSNCTIVYGEEIEVPEPNYSATGIVSPYDSWGKAVLPDSTYGAITPTVESYDGYVIVRAFAGVEGYDMKVAYDSAMNVVGIAGIVNGVEDTMVTSGYANVYTGLTGDSDYYFQAYVGSGYGYVKDNGTDSGYVLQMGYMGSLYGVYYVTWPYSNDPTLYVVGLNNNWDPSNPMEVEAENGVYTIVMPEGDTQFKISTAKGADSSDWTTFNAGAYNIKDTEKIADNTGETKYELVSGDQNIQVAYAEGQWTITVDLANLKISGVNATDEPKAEIPETCYIIGEVAAGSWNPATVVALTKSETEEGIFSGSVEFSGVYFSICEKQGTEGDWSSIGTRWGAVTNDYNLEVGVPATIVKGNNDNAFKMAVEAPGVAAIVVNFKDMTVVVNEFTGVEGIIFNSVEPIEYYNLQGVRVANPSNGVYIMRQGNTAAKVYVK